MTCVCLFVAMYMTISLVYLQTHLFGKNVGIVTKEMLSFSVWIIHMQVIQTHWAVVDGGRMEPRNRVITSSKHLSHPSCNIYNSASSLFNDPVCSWHQFPLSWLCSSTCCFFLPHVFLFRLLSGWRSAAALWPVWKEEADRRRVADSLSVSFEALRLVHLPLTAPPTPPHRKTLNDNFYPASGPVLSGGPISFHTLALPFFCSQFS